MLLFSIVVDEVCVFFFVFFFFFKQKTAYEIGVRLVGSEMCIRDRYCDGLAPGDKRGRTCRQVGNLRGREQRELAADHPIKKIYTKRFNTITQYLGRGTLDEQTAAAMKALAKSKLEKALQDSGYAQGGYAAEMEQAALLAEVKETIER